MTARVQRAFTLVEILIVVVILGILAAIVVPQFINATGEAQSGATLHDLENIRRAIDVYMARHANAIPPVDAGDGTWGELTAGGNYLKSPPTNAWAGGANSQVIVLGDTPDGVYHQDYGWIFDPATGDIWAAAFDGSDNPLPRP